MQKYNASELNKIVSIQVTQEGPVILLDYGVEVAEKVIKGNTPTQAKSKALNSILKKEWQMQFLA